MDQRDLQFQRATQAHVFWVIAIRPAVAVRDVALGADLVFIRPGSSVDLWGSGDAQWDLCQYGWLENSLGTKKRDSPASKCEAFGQRRAREGVPVNVSEFIKIGKRCEAYSDVVLGTCHPAIVGQIADDATVEPAGKFLPDFSSQNWAAPRCRSLPSRLRTLPTAVGQPAADVPGSRPGR